MSTQRRLQALFQFYKLGGTGLFCILAPTKLFQDRGSVVSPTTTTCKHKAVLQVLRKASEDAFV